MNTNPMTSEPWTAIRQIAERTARAYDPGDDSPEPARCDLQLVIDAIHGAGVALDGARDTPEDSEASNAVGKLLRTLERILTGLSGDVRDLASAAGDAADGCLGPGELPDALGELAGDLVALRGPKP